MNVEKRNAIKENGLNECGKFFHRATASFQRPGYVGTQVIILKTLSVNTADFRFKIYDCNR